MSLQRIQSLDELLESRGWLVTDMNFDKAQFRNGESSFEKIIEITGYDGFTWKLSRRKSEKSIILDFLLVEQFGNRTISLGDLFSVQVRNTELVLYFDKIKSEKWLQELKQFVDKLR